MIYEREHHIEFLERELNAQTEVFKQKLETSALYMLQEKEEIFIAQLVKIEDGEMILRFPNTIGLPRQGDYLYCMLCNKEMRNYRNWTEITTYGDLIKNKTDYTEVVCIWQSPSEDKEFSLVGFRGIDLDFANRMKDSNVIFILGPNKPPYEYIENLKRIVSKRHNTFIADVLDSDFVNSDLSPIILQDNNIDSFILNQLELDDSIILQGPPGTGKTYLISKLCSELCAKGKSVLVTALTNRALIEIAEKPPLEDLLNNGMLFKTKISVDESRLLNNLNCTKEITPIVGGVILSTFFIASGKAADVNNCQLFDYVIVDEASQALLAMFAAAKLLGKKTIFIGDTKQLPPVVSISEDVVNRQDYYHIVNGFKSLCDLGMIPNYQLTYSRRLPVRAAGYTGNFYNNTLVSRTQECVVYNDIPSQIKPYFHKNGGPTLLKGKFNIGDMKPKNAVLIVLSIIKSLYEMDKLPNIAILTYFVETTKFIQKSIAQILGIKKGVLIDTVSRVQGLTTDICIFVIPNTSYHRFLETRLFNVATSRAKGYTIIIADENIYLSSSADKYVKLVLVR